MSNVNIVGRREEGKTTLAMYLSRRYTAKIVWDPRCMIDGVIVYNCDDLEGAIEEKAWNDGAIIYRPESGDVKAEFTEVCAVLFPPRFSRGGFAFLVDESGELQNAHGIHPELMRVVKQHPTKPPRESVMVIQTNHRLAEFNNSCKALLDELYIFQTTLPGDLDTLEVHTGLPQLTPIVSSLPPHHCVRYLYGRQPQGMEQYEIWDNSNIWYAPLKSPKGGIYEGGEGNGLPTNNNVRKRDSKETSSNTGSHSCVAVGISSYFPDEEDCYAE